MTELDSTQLDAGQREVLRELLRETIHKQRADENRRKLLDPQLDQLERLHDRLASDDIRDQLAWVFSHAPRLLHPRPGAYFDRDAMRVAQHDAARRLAETLPQSDLVAFASRVGNPWSLGYALANLGDSDAQAVELLRATIGEASEARHGFLCGIGHALYQRWNGFEGWQGAVIRDLPTDMKADLLQGYPSRPETWDFVDSLGPDVADAYWREVELYRHEFEHIGRVVRSLAGVGRIDDATELLASARVSGGASLESETVVELLDATLCREHSDRMSGYLLTALLEQLRAEGDRWHDELLRFEWNALPILDIHHGERPTTHYAELALRPKFFVDMVHLAKSWSEEMQADAERAWTLLEDWRGLPGRRDDGTIDADALRQWVEQARALLHETELSNVGDERLGEVLGNSPEGVDGLWPHEAVREIIERLGDVPRLRAGIVAARERQETDFHIDTERDHAQAEQLRADADTLRIRHPYTARILDELAENTKHRAQLFSRVIDQYSDWTSPVTTETRINRALDEFEASGRLVFDYDMLVAELGHPRDLSSALRRHRRVAHIEDDLYVIVEPRYRRNGAPPPRWYIDELMRRTETRYCVGLLSAAALHGAADQQPQVFQVLVNRARRSLTVGVHKIEFVHRGREQPFKCMRVNTETGTMAVATPEATLFDLSEFADRCGGDDAVITVIEDLAEDIDVAALLTTAADYPPEIVARAIALLVESGHEQLAQLLREPSAQRAIG